MDEKNLKCIEYFCPLFQTCARAVLSCGSRGCAGGEVVPAVKCMLLPDKPYYVEQINKESQARIKCTKKEMTVYEVQD